MASRVFSTLAAVAAATWFQATASATVIFDNTSPGDHGITATSAPQLGDEVTASPSTPRKVTELDIGFTSQGLPATADLQAFLYDNSGSGGSPGTLLWQSAVMPGVSIASTNVLIAFIVPSILVPNTFTFTSAITNVHASASVGYVPAVGATTGTFVTAWVGSPGSWGALLPVFETEGRVVAASVPEPATLTLLGLGLAGLGFSRRRKSN